MDHQLGVSPDESLKILQANLEQQLSESQRPCAITLWLGTERTEKSDSVTGRSRRRYADIFDTYVLAKSGLC